MARSERGCWGRNIVGVVLMPRYSIQIPRDGCTYNSYLPLSNLNIWRSPPARREECELTKKVEIRCWYIEDGVKLAYSIIKVTYCTCDTDVTTQTPPQNLCHCLSSSAFVSLRVEKLGPGREVSVQLPPDDTRWACIVRSG